MDIAHILSELKTERACIDIAITALESTSAPRRRIRPSGSAGLTKRVRRHMSAAARKRIGEAKRKWWAERRKKARKR